MDVTERDRDLAMLVVSGTPLKRAASLYGISSSRARQVAVGVVRLCRIRGAVPKSAARSFRSLGDARKDAHTVVTCILALPLRAA